MAEGVKCPNSECGRTTPALLDECQYCGEPIDE